MTSIYEDYDIGDTSPFHVTHKIEILKQRVVDAKNELMEAGLRLSITQMKHKAHIERIERSGFNTCEPD